MRLEGKVAIVTGASRGIGRAIALAFSKEGADLTVVSRTLHEVEDVASQIRALGRQALALKVDVSRTEDVQRMISQTAQEIGRIDILVNNAGTIGPIGPVVENDAKQWTDTIRVNLVGVFLCCRAVLPYMIKQRKGKIINLSGGGAAYPRPRFSAYASSKAAVVRFTETLAEEVREFNIQVNVMAPGAVKTSMHEQILARGEDAGGAEVAKSSEVLKKGGTSPDVAAALAVFLASDESDGLTGKFISAVWDDWKNLTYRVNEVTSSDLYTLRRIVSKPSG